MCLPFFKPFLLAFSPKKATGLASAFQSNVGLSKEGLLSQPLLVRWGEGYVWCQQKEIPFFGLFVSSVTFPAYPICHFPGPSLSFGAFPPKVTCLNPYLPAALQFAKHSFYERVSKHTIDSLLLSN